MNSQEKTDSKIPVAVLTGFLGSGKTTLLSSGVVMSLSME